MDKDRKLELVNRSLALKHKLKVHDSMKMPEHHDELTHSILAKWELEDELKAIEELLAETRAANVKDKKQLLIEKKAP